MDKQLEMHKVELTKYLDSKGFFVGSKRKSIEGVLHAPGQGPSSEGIKRGKFGTPRTLFPESPPK